MLQDDSAHNLKFCFFQWHLLLTFKKIYFTWMEQTWEVIVIGAGISGLAASQILTEAHIPHIVLESRDRIGGRIRAAAFEGEQVDWGATFVHYPDQPGHPLAQIMADLSWSSFSANYDSEAFMMQDRGELSAEEVQKIYICYDKLTSLISSSCKESDKDISLLEAAQHYLSEDLAGEIQVVRRGVEWLINEYANVEGSELDKVSAQGSEFKTLRKDVIPVGGFPKLLQAIFEGVKKNVLFNQRVTKIDYSSNIVKIYTSSTVYNARRVISSLPLGVMQHRKVEFSPPLPQKHQESLQKIGVGIFNKLFISFEEPFWGTRKGWLHMVTSSGSSKYPQIFILPQYNKPMICVQISGEASQQLSQMNDADVVADFVSFLKGFFKEEIKVKDYTMTRWHKDEDSMGSYCYIRVGTTEEDLLRLREPIQGKIWMIGEHTNPEKYALTHGAYQTGVSAAKEIVRTLSV